MSVSVHTHAFRCVCCLYVCMYYLRTYGWMDDIFLTVCIYVRMFLCRFRCICVNVHFQTPLFEVDCLSVLYR